MYETDQYNDYWNSTMDTDGLLLFSYSAVNAPVRFHVFMG